MLVSRFDERRILTHNIAKHLTGRMRCVALSQPQRDLEALSAE